MNKFKQGFAEQFGDFSQQRDNLKQRVLTKQKKRPLRWHYALIAAIVVVAMACFLVSQLPKQQTAAVATLSERYFDVLYFDTYYLSQEFNRSAENYEQVLHQVIQEAALIDYAKSKGVTVSQEEQQALKDGFLTSFTEGIKDSEMATFRYQVLFDEFNLTAKSYTELLAQQQLVVPLYTQRLVEVLEADVEQSFEDEGYVQLLNDALQAFNAKYADEIEILLEEFKPIASTSISAPIETMYTEFGEFSIFGRDEKFYFAAKNEAVNTLLMNAMSQIEHIEQQHNLGYLCTYTLDSYIKGAQKVAQETNAKADQDLVKLLTILKQTIERY